MPDTTLCRSCGMPIMFVPTPTGKRMPLNAEPDPEGSAVIRDGVCHILPADADTGEVRFKTHWSSCAQADAHRKRLKGGGK